MAGMGSSTLSKSFCTGLNHASRSRITRSFRPSIAFTNSSDRFFPPPPPNSIASTSVRQIINTHFIISPLQSLVDNRGGHSVVPISDFFPRCLQNRELSSFQSRATAFPVFTSNISSFRAYSSFFGRNADNSKGPSQAPEVTATSSVVNESNADQSGVVGSDLVEKLKGAWQSAVDSAGYAGEKAKEASDELTPYVQQLLDSHPYLRNVIIPVGGTLIGTVLAWVVMPRVLRKLHKYSMQGPTSLLYGSSIREQVPYDKSIWAALEDPVRYLITFMAFSQLGVMIAPTTIASQYIAPAWRGAVILAFVWFLHRWKTNVFTGALAVQNIVGLDRDKLLALDKLSSVGLFVLGLMALAEACGVAVQSILTVGGIGGVATAFAARDILGNVLSGLSMQFSKPFSLGDTIKAGSIEGQVVEMGLTTTSLLNAEKFPVIVPNSLFSSQVIVNKSRAQWRAMVTKIPIRINDLEKIPQISEDIKSILKLNPKVSLGMEAPYCFISRIENSYAELSVGCILKLMSKDEFYSTEQDILLKAVEIIQKHGAALGSTLQDSTYQ